MGLTKQGQDVFIEPGKPTQNGQIESFNGKLRDECLNLESFTSLYEARTLIEKWRESYNQVRLHSALGNLPPASWLQKQQTAAGTLHSQLALTWGQGQYQDVYCRDLALCGQTAAANTKI